MHVGADADATNKITGDIDSMSAAGLGIKDINVKDTTGMAGTYAIDAINDAIATVSSQRSALGAVQNRLEHTIANLDNVVENTTSAESRIRDTDMAEEMVNYSKNSILQQAGQSMLAQANQANQGVLSLLQKLTKDSLFSYRTNRNIVLLQNGRGSRFGFLFLLYDYNSINAIHVIKTLLLAPALNTDKASPDTDQAFSSCPINTFFPSKANP